MNFIMMFFNLTLAMAFVLIASAFSFLKSSNYLSDGFKRFSNYLKTAFLIVAVLHVIVAIVWLFVELSQWFLSGSLYCLILALIFWGVFGCVMFKGPIDFKAFWKDFKQNLSSAK